jgi:hypothetical protein
MASLFRISSDCLQIFNFSALYGRNIRAFLLSSAGQANKDIL